MRTKGSFNSFLSALTQTARKLLRKGSADEDLLLTEDYDDLDEFERIEVIKRPKASSAAEPVEPYRTVPASHVPVNPTAPSAPATQSDPKKQPEPGNVPELEKQPEPGSVPELEKQPEPGSVPELEKQPEPGQSGNTDTRIDEETARWQKGMEQCNRTVDFFLQMIDTPHSSMASRLQSHYMIACRKYLKMSERQIDFYSFAEQYFKEQIRETSDISDRKEIEVSLRFLPLISSESDIQTLLNWIRKEL
ncbi:MAG: hypothetical protein MJY79_08945 [Bacteroidaceae bacterium]|nr:hypothetical protein [Bacteroidaceae bacterium]